MHAAALLQFFLHCTALTSCAAAALRARTRCCWSAALGFRQPGTHSDSDTRAPQHAAAASIAPICPHTQQALQLYHALRERRHTAYVFAARPEHTNQMKHALQHRSSTEMRVSGVTRPLA
jgi:hypothetical protein